MATDTAHRYEIHGFQVESEIPLEANSVEGPSPGEFPTPDFRIRIGESRPVPMATPRGRLLGTHRKLEYGYWATELRGGRQWSFRYGNVCDAVIDVSGGDITVHPDPGADPAMISITAGGGVLAHAAVARGALLLHACAVEVDGRAVAITGITGSGKSTLSAVLCAAGARLVADDALRCDAGPTGVTCYPGNNVLRLRPGAAELAAQVGSADVGISIDERIAIRPRATRVPVKLEVVLAPVPTHGAEGLELTPLDRMEGMIELIRNPRPNAWTDKELVARLFDQTAEVAAHLSFVRARIPWGPPFPSGLTSELMQTAGFSPVDASTGRG